MKKSPTSRRSTALRGKKKAKGRSRSGPERQERKRRLSSWSNPKSELSLHLEDQVNRSLAAYREQPLLVEEHANIERATAQGGYGRRQIYELVQNGADALLDHRNGRIHVVLTEDALYCANEGEPIDRDGVDAILSSHVSMKRGTEIGRFGLGFKSVLGVTDRPEFYSRSGSFSFNGDEAAERIRGVVPGSERTPVLRIAWPRDPMTAMAGDSQLKQLMSWATTVVRLPFDHGKSDWLSEDIEQFPSEFLLFSPHLGRLILEDRTRGLLREIQVRTRGNTYKLVEGDQQSTWRVFARQHKPSRTARKDAGELADRDSLPIIWAVPVKGRMQRGQFWAFFPTEYVTTLSGIANAPWKTNEDRQNLLTGPFNEELLDVLSELVAENLASLTETSDPARLLDLMPARGREAPNWADERVTNRVYELAREKPTLPDQHGILTLPAELLLHPAELKAEALRAWASYDSRPTDWCHSSVETRERRPRAERLVGEDSIASISDWLEALVQDATPEGSIAALRTAAILHADTDSEGREEVERSEIVLTTTGKLVAADPTEVFLSGDHISSSDVVFVHRQVEADPRAQRALAALDISGLDAEGEFEAFVSDIRPLDDVDWDLFWKLARRLPPSRAASLLDEYEYAKQQLRVRTVGGDYRPLGETLMPGPVVPADGSRDADVAMDPQFHQGEMELLGRLGAVSTPSAGAGRTSGNWYDEYRESALEDYYSRLDGRRRPQSDYLTFEHSDIAGPLDPLWELSDEGRALYSAALLQAEAEWVPWVVKHRTRSDTYPETQFSHPSPWALRQQGLLPTSAGPRTCAESVGPQFEEHRVALPVAECSVAQAQALGLPATPADIPQAVWEVALAEALESEDDGFAGRFYALAAEWAEPPRAIRCRSGEELKAVPPARAGVVWKTREYDALRALGLPLVLAHDGKAAQSLIRRWGLRPSDELARREIESVVEVGPTLLTDEFPPARLYLPHEWSQLVLFRCSDLQVSTLSPAGKTRQRQDLAIEGNKVYWVDGGDDRALFRELGAELEIALASDAIDHIVASRGDANRRRLISQIRRMRSDDTRLLAAVGPEMLRRRLPAPLLAALEESEGELEPRTLGRLALAVYGVNVLREFRDELEERGLQPPSQWAGRRTARVFVRELGFSFEYAGFEEARRDPLLRIEGPPHLPPLHEFQSVIAEEVSSLLRSKTSKRGLLSLPTGAGKTRIVVEALVRAFGSGELEGPVLWIAPTDELCEQAVQTWDYVWRAIGPKRTLHVSRLWSSNEAEELPGEHQVVVATMAKMSFCRTDEEYGWLSRPACVVIDEAHSSVTPQYTALLKWLGLDRSRKRDRQPLIGLTATPFRGVSEKETQRLVRRYNETRLDKGVLGDDQYVELQAMRVLSRVKHRLLPGTSIRLSDDELAHLRQTRRLPSSATERLGDNRKRNKSLIKTILDLPEDWPVLLFATSVAHAELIAAMLSLEGVKAAAISAKTERGARHHYVDQFRRGGVRVLTNFGVLTEGFDAPATRVVIVARPTFSPNAYQQMIGRGLRGPLNGGKGECLIVNVADNVAQYGEELAFREFEYLWKRSRGRPR